VLPVYVRIQSSIGAIAGIQSAFKRKGMMEAKEGRIPQALDHFYQSVYAYALYGVAEKMEYDFDILECIERMARPYRFPSRSIVSTAKGRKIRVAYLTHASTMDMSSVARLNLDFARFHDRSRFEVNFFFSLQESEFRDKEIIEHLKAHGCSVFVLPELGSDEAKLFWTAMSIYRFRPDILVTNAGLADLRNYFVVCMRPAPVVVGQVLGPPPACVGPGMDWSISLSMHPLMDSPCDCSLVDIETDLPRREDLGVASRGEYGIPEDGIVIMSGGRGVKFQNERYWRTILSVLESNPKVYFVAIGAMERELAFARSLLSSPAGKQLKLVPRVGMKAYLSLLGLADIFVDTFPSGGGLILMDAMALSLPVLTFENDYLQTYNQAQWSVGGEIVGIRELMVKRSDWGQLKSVLMRLIGDRSYRSLMGRLCEEKIRSSRGNPRRMVKRHEDIYTMILDRIPNGVLPHASGATMERNMYRRSFARKLFWMYWIIRMAPPCYRVLRKARRFWAGKDTQTHIRRSHVRRDG
jgi:hypothetical protein